jgi:hypothetical protein
VFADFFDNSLFLFIVTITVTVQVLLVQFGGEAVRCTPLTLNQHLACVAIGVLSLVFGYLAKLLPLRHFQRFRLNEEPIQMSFEEKYEHYRSSLKKSRSYLSRSFQSQHQHPGGLSQSFGRQGTLKVLDRRHSTTRPSQQTNVGRSVSYMPVKSQM